MLSFTSVPTTFTDLLGGISLLNNLCLGCFGGVGGGDSCLGRSPPCNNNLMNDWNNRRLGKSNIIVLLVTPTREHADEYLAELLHALLA